MDHYPFGFFIKKRKKETSPAERQRSYIDSKNREICLAGKALVYLEQLRELRRGEYAHSEILDLMAELTENVEKAEKMSFEDFNLWRTQDN